MVYPGRLGDHYTGLGIKNTCQIFFFQLYFHKKNIEVAINDFTMDRIIGNGLEDKMWTEEKNKGTGRHRSENRKLSMKMLPLIYQINHANVCFFFLISLQTCSHSLGGVNSLHCFVQFLLYYLLHLFSSNRFAALTSL